MLTTTRKQQLREQLESIEKNGGVEAVLAGTMREILAEMPTNEHAEAVEELRKEPQAAYQRDFQGRGHGLPPKDATTTAADVGKK